MTTPDARLDPQLPSLLLDESSRVPPLDPSRKVYVNRNLRLSKIETVGFDMDYTLAIYKKHQIEKLAFECTVHKLVAAGYPNAVRGVRYEPDRVIRGLVVDKSRGNIFKADRYGHVGRVFHGLKELSKDERIELYRKRKIDLDSEGFLRVDTLFSLPEACLYVQLVDWLDREQPSVDYARVAGDVRAAIDAAHADGSIKTAVREHPETYIEKSDELALTLHRLRSSGKKLFLLTNSYWPYTNAIMSFLLDGVIEGYPTWRSYFDLSIAGARKPSFFRQSAPFFRIDEETNAPCAQPAAALEKGRAYQGGSLAGLERVPGFAGDSVLYVGDHIYGDILLSKKSSLWRTCMIVPELEDVVWHEELHGPDLLRRAVLDAEVQRADYGINYYKLLLNRLEKLERQGGEADGTGDLGEADRRSRHALEQLRKHRRERLRDYEAIGEEIDLGYNPYWGRLFVEGSETSLFGQQVENFACVYTSRVSNFAYYSPVQYFRSPPERLPHERFR